MNVAGKTVVSRADLLRLSKAFGEQALDHICAFAGYYRKADIKRAEGRVAEGSTTVTAIADVISTGHAVHKEINTTFWRPVSSTPLKPQEDTTDKPRPYIEAEPFQDQEIRADRSLSPPSQPPLCPWSRLWPFLRGALGAYDRRGTVDMPQAVRWAAQMRPVRRLPRMQRRGWARRCMLIVDFDTCLVPFWQDMHVLYRHLAGIRGENGLDQVTFLHGPLGPVAQGNNDSFRLKTFSFPEPDTPILILGDLGLFGHSERVKQEWLHFGRQLRQSGCAPVVLTPAPRRLWTDELAKVYRMACWDRGQRLPRISGPLSVGSKPLATDEKRNGTDLLISLLSPAVRVEPALLRAARLLLPIDRADAGDEAAVWHHDHVRRSYNGFSFDPRHVADWRRAFVQHHGDDLRQRLVELIQAHHRHLSPAVYLEEQLIAAMALNKEPTPEVDQFFWCCLKTAAGSEFAEKSLLESYLQRVPHRHEYDPAMWKSDVMCALHVSANRDAWLKGKLILPLGADPACAAFLVEQGPVEGYTLCQRGPYFIIQKWMNRFGDAYSSSGSPVINLISFDGVLQVQALDGKDETQAIAINLKGPTPVPIEIPEKGELRLITTHQEIMLKSMRRPSWAQGWGRDEQGLFLELPGGGEPRRVRWLAPGRYSMNGRTSETDADVVWEELPTPQGPHRVEIDEGFWWDEQDYLEFLESGFQRPEWVRTFSFGRDEYGIYADFQYAGVTQRMRWIWPGQFMMGSPKSEVDRENDEQQHEVILTHGFWLAETACTQALWQAVMGKKSSGFKGRERPVDNVSWGDCQVFLKKINAAIPGIELHLPTEAQWEYACRAGTSTPFHFGDNITTSQVNFDGKNPYNKGEKGQYRKQTVPVKIFACNDWGLYEMHGNVKEWCADWYGTYPETTAIDPLGPREGDIHVFRGGSWNLKGRFVRSAYRGRLDSFFRVTDVGFRVARSQTSSTLPGEAGQSQEIRKNKSRSTGKASGSKEKKFLRRLLKE